MTWDKGWDSLFKKYKWGTYPNEHLVRFLKSDLKKPQKKNLKILEIGCGTGANFYLYNKEKLKIFAIDGSQNAIKFAKKQAKENDYIINFEIGDIEKLPYENSFFDYVVDVECLYSNDESSTRKILLEINRVLKNSGKFFSLSFGTKTSGYSSGKKLKNENNTFTEVKSGALKSDYNLIRYMTKKDILDIYSCFKIVSIDNSIWTKNNEKLKIQEWIIVCQKKI